MTPTIIIIFQNRFILQSINNRQIPDNYVILSLDVVNLFGNISIQLVKSVLSNKWENIRPHAKSVSKSTSLNLFNILINIRK